MQCWLIFKIAGRCSNVSSSQNYDTDSPQGEQTPGTTTTVQTVQPSRYGSESPNLVVNVPFSNQLTIRTQMSRF